MHLLWTPSADAVMRRLEDDATLSDILAAARRTLGGLERDPYERRLRTRQFSTEAYGQLRATPVGKGEWTVYWMTGPGDDEITVVFIADASV